MKFYYLRWFYSERYVISIIYANVQSVSARKFFERMSQGEIFELKSSLHCQRFQILTVLTVLFETIHNALTLKVSQ
jgi:hypothetical protein